MTSYGRHTPLPLQPENETTEMTSSTNEKDETERYSKHKRGEADAVVQEGAFSVNFLESEPTPG